MGQNELALRKLRPQLLGESCEPGLRAAIAFVHRVEVLCASDGPTGRKLVQLTRHALATRERTS